MLRLALSAIAFSFLGAGAAWAACPAPGSGISASGSGTVVNESGCTITTSTAGVSGISSTSQASVTLTNGEVLVTGSDTPGVTLDTNGIVNLVGSSVRTETGAGIQIRGASTFTATDLEIITNDSQQDLIPILQALPEYPVLTGDSIDVDRVGDPLGLDVYAIASPSKGIDLVTGIATLNGSTSIRAGGTGIYADNGTVNINGPLTLNAGPGGTANSWMYGIQVQNAGTANINADATINVDSVAGSGLYAAGVGSRIIINNATTEINLTNTQNTGINNVNEAAALYASPGEITVTGNLLLDAKQGRGYGLWTGGTASSTITVNGTTDIKTHGREAFGIRLDGGTINLNGNLTMATGIDPSSADALDGAASAGLRAISGTLTATGNTTITTVGGVGTVGTSGVTRESAYGLWNTSYSRLQGNGGALTFGSTTIQTAGAAAHGIYNDSVSGTFNFTGPVNITTTGGTGSVTWHRTFNGILSTITNETVGAWGVNSAISGTTTFQQALTVNTSGASSGGLRSIGGTIAANGPVNVTTAGSSAYGAWASSGTAAGTTYNGIINIGGMATITTSGAGAHGLYANLGGTLGFTGGATLRVADSAAFGILAADTAQVTGSGRFDVVANLQSQDNSVMNLTMAPGSVFEGKTARTGASTFNLTLVDSLWKMTGSSTLSTLVNDPSLIDFAAPTGDPTQLASYMTLTVNNYVGDGGQIALNTYLAGDGSPSDMLVIDGGSATGNSGLIIKNTGGGGALTTGDGILVVEAINNGTTNTDAFSLAAPAVAGPYEYTLFRSSVDGSAPDNWYLRSVYVPPPDPPIPPTPHYRQEVSLIAAVPPLAALYGRTLIDTYHERIGEQRLGVGDVEVGDDGKGPVWARVLGVYGRHGGDPLGIYAGSEPSFDYRLLGFQGGMDLYRNDDPDGDPNTNDRDVAGAYAAFGSAWGDVDHSLPDHTINAGTDTLFAWSLGGYWTHYFDNAAYLDAVVQGTFYDVTTASRRLPSAHTNGYGLAGSLEGGYPITLSEGWVLEPQAQLVLQAINISGFNEGASDISFSDTNSAVGRIGARLAHSFEVDKGDGTIMPVTAWGRVNLFHEFLGRPVTTFSSEDGPVSFPADLSETWVQLGIGGDVKLSPTAKMYGQVSYDTTFDGKSYAVEGKFGFKVSW